MSPSYLMYKVMVERSPILTDLKSTSSYNFLGVSKITLGKVILPSMALGSIFYLTYQIYRKCIWSNFPLDSERFSLVACNTSFGFIVGATLNPYLLLPLSMAGLTMGFS
jgi:hypothetical protein